MINNNKLIIRDNRGCSIIEFSKIVYFQGKGMYTEIYFNDSRFIISKNIKCIEDKLPDYIFVRIHQSYIININRIKQVISKGKSIIITDTGIELPVSKKYKCKLKLIIEDTYIKI